MSDAPRLLIVRLRNWVGDVTLGVPTLQRLADAGHELRLLGKGWARDLLAGHGWQVTPLAKTTRERVAQLRTLRCQALADDPGFARHLNAVCFPYSFSSALEFRLAGLKAIGHAHEARSLLLARALARPRSVHELQVYWQLGSAFLGRDAPLPAAIDLRVSTAHDAAARALLAAHGVAPGCIVICPFAGGTFEGRDKSWPAFAEFAAQVLPAFGRPLVICPGPGEQALAQARFGGATLLADVNLGVYAALLKHAALMISNDTGPGHIAAAVGTPLLSVLGPTDPRQWGAWGPHVTLLRGRGGAAWPSVAQARDAVAALLAPR